jgi:dTDP-4-amino-4,6-dideoxygalactose transaminase
VPGISAGAASARFTGKTQARRADRSRTEIGLVDLGIQHDAVADEVAEGFAEVLRRGDFIGGEAVVAFEREYAAFIGVKHCVGVGNGTDALELALRALGVGTGDEVILPATTFVATAEAVVRAGALPILVDVDDDALLMDPSRLAGALTPQTKALIPVHLYGQAAPVEQLASALGDRDIPILEDAAQAQGARRHGRSAGALGAIAATSFYPGKNLGAYGDAGAVLTDDDELARAVRLLGAHGSAVKYEHERLGFNSRLDTLQAVVLRAKLRRLAGWNEQRREAAARYRELLSDVPEVRLPGTLAGNEHVWHLFVVRLRNRDAALRRLRERGVTAGIHYPVPVHLQPAFRFVAKSTGSFPVTERAAREVLSLPLYPGMTEEQQARVVDALAEGLRFPG